MLSCHDLETTCLFSCCNTRVPVHCTDKVTRIQTVVSVEETVGEARVYRSGASPAKSAIAIDTKAQTARGEALCTMWSLLRSKRLARSGKLLHRREVRSLMTTVRRTDGCYQVTLLEPILVMATVHSRGGCIGHPIALDRDAILPRDVGRVGSGTSVERLSWHDD